MSQLHHAWISRSPPTSERRELHLLTIDHTIPRRDGHCICTLRSSLCCVAGKQQCFSTARKVAGPLETKLSGCFSEGTGSLLVWLGRTRVRPMRLRAAQIEKGSLPRPRTTRYMTTLAGRGGTCAHHPHGQPSVVSGQRPMAHKKNQSARPASLPACQPQASTPSPGARLPIRDNLEPLSRLGWP